METTPPSIGNMEYEYDVFLSHDSRDKVAVEKLANRLKQDGLRVWFDAWVIKPGDSIPLLIRKGFETSRVMVLVLSRHFAGAKWSQMELGTAISRDPTNEERRFIPLRLDDSKIPDILIQYGYVDYCQENGYQQLLAACKRNTAGEEKEQEPKSADDRAAYKRNTEKLFNKLKQDIAKTLAGSNAAMDALEANANTEAGTPEDRAVQLMERLIAMEFTLCKNRLLAAHKILAGNRDRAGQKVIEKVARKLIPWLYVTSSRDSGSIEGEWGENASLGYVLKLPAGIASFASIIMAGLDRREVFWDSLEGKWPIAEQGGRLSGLIGQPESGITEATWDNVVDDLGKRSQIPTEAQNLSRKDKIQPIIIELEEAFKESGVRVFYLIDYRPINQWDRIAYEDLCKRIQNEFPTLALVAMDSNLLTRDQKLFNEIRPLLLTE
ncbi:MAG: WD-repeat protein [Magnetococcales bacterium]|nr:WD-repeat protein [Magnetococcales bacterium]